VRGQAHGDAVVADRDVGVMVLRLGRGDEAVHERDGLGEARELVGAGERLAVATPSGEGSQGVFDFSRGE